MLMVSYFFFFSLFVITCVTGKTVTTEKDISFNRDSNTVCTITGSNTDGTCVLELGYTTDYAYTCNPTSTTYTVTIPGSSLTDNLHGTTWICGNPFGGAGSNTKILYVNGELFFLFFLFFVITTLVNIIIPRHVPKLL
jgi:hypothetical protein